MTSTALHYHDSPEEISYRSANHIPTEILELVEAQADTQ